MENNEIGAWLVEIFDIARFSGPPQAIIHAASRPPNHLWAASAIYDLLSAPNTYLGGFRLAFKRSGLKQ